MKKYLLKYRFLLLLTLLLTFIYISMDVGVVFIIKRILDTAVTKQFDLFYKAIFVYIIWNIALYLVKYISRMTSLYFIRKTLVYLKNDIFGFILKKHIVDFQKSNSGEYISNLTNDISLLQKDYFDNIFQIFNSISSLVLGIIVIAYMNIYVLLGIILFTALNIILSAYFGKMASKYTSKYSTDLSKFTEKTKDFFSGFEVIKSFNIEQKVEESYKKYNTQLEDSKFSVNNFGNIMEALLGLIGQGTFIIAILVGGYLVIKEHITIGSMIAAIQLMNNIVNPIKILGVQLSRLKSIKPIEYKINNIKKLHLDNYDSQNLLSKETLDDKIIFDSVSFSYNDDREILKDVSFEIEKGKKYAIVGDSGSGKTTLVKLLLKYYSNFKGNIKIDNISIKEISSTSLYKLISMIHQNIFMFDGSVRDNITLFDNYDENIINDVIKLSGLEQTVNNLPNGKDSLVGENGSNLSGGEKQRIAIARALIRKNSLLILDEATSSLDSKTSKAIEETILNMKDLTCITITHKISKNILSQYDKILVIKDGRIEEMASFEELVENKKEFYTMLATSK